MGSSKQRQPGDTPEDLLQEEQGLAPSGASGDDRRPSGASGDDRRSRTASGDDR